MSWVDRRAASPPIPASLLGLAAGVKVPIQLTNRAVVVYKAACLEMLFGLALIPTAPVSQAEERATVTSIFCILNHAVVSCCKRGVLTFDK